MSRRVPVVSARSATDIERIAESFIRSYYPELLGKAGPLPIEQFIDRRMRKELGFTCDVQPLSPPVEAIMDPVTRRVIFDTETYDDMMDGFHRARFGGSHEVGHVVLHADYLQEKILDGRAIVRLNRGEFPAYQDPEWQANRFAAGILMPRNHVKRLLLEGANADDLVRVFNVSPEAASIRIDQFQKKRPSRLDRERASKVFWAP